MATTSELDRVSMVVLRYMRGPVFVLIVVYAIGITGMALIPGRDADGNVEYMNLFHSFYFFTYTATTTGFGEIPNEFTDEQRLWAILCLYMGVVAWLYAIGSIFRLVQNPHFLLALNEHRFAKKVRRIQHPFFIICGFRRYRQPAGAWAQRPLAARCHHRHRPGAHQGPGFTRLSRQDARPVRGSGDSQTLDRCWRAHAELQGCRDSNR